MTWRFESIDHPDVEINLSRDTDTRFLLREKSNEKRLLFLKSNSLDEFSERSFIDKWLKLLTS
mgnify:CR=1 FL=1